MVSIGVDVSSIVGSDSLNNSKGILGVFDSLNVFLLGTLLLTLPDFFIYDSINRALFSHGLLVTVGVGMF